MKNKIKVAVIVTMIMILTAVNRNNFKIVNAMEDMNIKEVTVTFAPALDMGDVNLDGKVDLSDAQLALKAALKVVELSPEAVAKGDINGNGIIDQADVQSILRMALAIQ